MALVKPAPAAGVPSVILLSGGLDSAANLALCRERDQPVLALTARYGQRAEAAEVRAARALAAYYEVPHAVVEIPWLGALGGSALTDSKLRMPSIKREELDDLQRTQGTAKAVWVPNRNGVLINIAAAYAERAGAERVVVGFNVEEAATFPDNSEAFLRLATQGLALSTANHVQVFSYSHGWDKRQIVAELQKLSRPFPFEKVWSCYEADAEPCGICESCQRFSRATAQVGAGTHGQAAPDQGRL